MGRFVANPDVLRTKGNEIINESQQFKQNVEKVFQTVNEMINSNYLDPAAIAIAREIESYRDDLNQMIRIIEDYGTFCLNASSRVIRNQDNIISEIK